MKNPAVTSPDWICKKLRRVFRLVSLLLGEGGGVKYTQQTELSCEQEYDMRSGTSEF